MAAGLVIVDKPSGMTSHDVVARVRGILRTRKVGHAGTLDPMATGLLVLGIDRATKLLGHLTLDRKSYLARIVLGASTVTEDAEGEAVASASAEALAAVSAEDIAAGVAGLTGQFQQVPSAVSAVKVGGRRAYERVRAGEHVELDPRPVTVHRFDLLAEHRHPGSIELDVLVECSSGTYVRALTRDLGSRLGVGAHLSELRRTRVGPFDLSGARSLPDLEAEPGLTLGMDEAVATAFPRHDVDDDAARAVRHGGRLSAAGVAGTYGIFGPDGRALALAVDDGPKTRSVVVLAPA